MLYIRCWACHRGIKPCCPVCETILSANNFFFRGSHEFLSACTLPKWVLESVATRVIMYYSNCLREALENLTASSKVVCNQTKSTLSSRLSLDSLEGDTFTVSMMDCEDGIISHMSSLWVNLSQEASKHKWSHPIFRSSFDHGSMPVVSYVHGWYSHFPLSLSVLVSCHYMHHGLQNFIQA